MEKEKIYLSVADFTIEIIFTKNEEFTNVAQYFISVIKDYYGNFLVDYKDQRVDYTIEVVPERSFQVFENKTSKKIFINFSEEFSKKKIRTYYHIGGTQFQILLRKITQNLLMKHGGIMLHSSAIQKNGKAYMFLGDSGAGKSTIMTLLSTHFTPMGDDTVIIRKEGNTFFCYSTSGMEKNAWFPKNSKKVPLAKVFFLHKSQKHKTLHLVDKEECISKLLKQVYSNTAEISEQFPKIVNFANSFDDFYLLKFSLKNKKILESIILSRN